jgi:hypothetical protein
MKDSHGVAGGTHGGDFFRYFGPFIKKNREMNSVKKLNLVLLCTFSIIYKGLMSCTLPQ